MKNELTALLPLLWPGFVSFLIAVVAYRPYIGWLKHKQIEQYIREEGPQSHAAKAKTPTMGGLCFIAIATITTLAYLASSWNVVSAGHLLGAERLSPVWIGLSVVIISALCGLVGFVDDYGKITSKSNRGLPAKARLLIEVVLGLLLGAIIYFLSPFGATLVLGPGADFLIGLRPYPVANFLYLFLFAPFLVAATTNAINLHDGMDGLAAGTSLQVFAVFFILLYFSGQSILAAISLAMCGCLIGFLVYNRYPAKVFMGDTGSLYIGGMMAALVLAGGLVFWFVGLAMIYILETLSVMAQVVYFKLTKEFTPEQPMSPPALIWMKLTRRLPGEGKRLFRMAPLHHHYEAVAAEKGMPEWQVVLGFWLTQLCLCAIVLSGFLGLLAYGKANAAY